MSLLIHPQSSRVIYHYRYEEETLLRHLDITDIVQDILSRYGSIKWGPLEQGLEKKEELNLSVPHLERAARKFDGVPSYIFFAESYITHKDIQVLLKILKERQQYESTYSP